jgi:hypothetical protein
LTLTSFHSRIFGECVSFPHSHPDWFPGTSCKRTAQQLGEQQEHAVNASYEWAKTQIVCIYHYICYVSFYMLKDTLQAERAKELSVVASLLEQAESLGLEPGEVDDCVKQVTVTLFAGMCYSTILIEES